MLWQRFTMSQKAPQRAHVRIHAPELALGAAVYLGRERPPARTWGDLTPVLPNRARCSDHIRLGEL